MHKKVRDVMTREVASVNGSTPFKDVAEVLVRHGVSAVPVVDGEGHVIGVISEADLLRKEEFREQYYGEDYRPSLRSRLRRHIGGQGGSPEEKARGESAAELMTKPAITVRSYTSVVTAARQMSEHGVKRLPVVDDDGLLEGIVSRHDLLTMFVRTDDDIADEVRDDIVEGALWPYSPAVHVSVAGGVVTLRGQMATRGDARMIVRMTERVNGVVDVLDELGWREDDIPAGD
ncbi:CBS domain-containing protein [Sphaerisporangium perillae]|uniref:CBS domain-containing protein n=1 Tax=Sphaerisporangium perillae TaxID=2935860 RepID=UPI00200FA06B|nr:CBS domain-containing protein [Sphaerisporangium perillae]